MIASVEGALQLGADAMLTYMFFGYGDPDAEARQAEDVARLAETCEAFGMGCIIEPMARGVRADHDIYRAEYVALGARIACELGADILKTDYTGSEVSAPSQRQRSARSDRGWPEDRNDPRGA